MEPTRDQDTSNGTPESAPEATPEPTPSAPAEPPPVAESTTPSASVPATTEQPGTGAVPEGKADIGKRFIAALIDGVLVGIVSSVIPIVGALAGAAYMLVRDGLDVDFMKKRSLGKHVIKLGVVRLDGQPVEMMDSVKRNFPFAIGPLIMVIPLLGWVLGPIIALIIGIIEVVLVLTDPEGRRIGDKIANTKVIETVT